MLNDCNGEPILLPHWERSRKGGKGQRAWHAPDKMPDVMVIEVLEGKVCGAQKKDGTFCKSRAVIIRENRLPPFRCRCHGGNAGMKAGKGHKPNLKHGLYAKGLLPGEQEVFDEIDVDEIDDEIKITKIRLARALEFEAKLETVLMMENMRERDKAIAKLMTLSEKHNEVTYDDAIGGGQKETKTRRLPDIKKIIDQCLNQLVKLKSLKNAAASLSNGYTAEERAARIREFLNATETLES